MLGRKAVCMLAVVLIAVCLATVILQSAMASPQTTRTKKALTFSLKIDTRAIQVGESAWTWLYVANPSADMEMAPSNPVPPPLEIKPVHRVEVHSLTITEVSPTGVTTISAFEPDGTDGIDELFRYRWDPVVYPLETSMVFFIGWGHEEGHLLGVYKYTYTLSVTYEGETFDLEQTFRLAYL
jgi:hypothetical protein